MRMKNADQLKGKIKNLARSRGVDPRVLLRIYMMERFLDRVSRSSFRESFVLKGGMLISYLVGVDMRTTMDIDTTMKDFPLTDGEIRRFVDEVVAVDAQDGVTFTLSGIDEIMAEADYPGMRVSLCASFDGTVTPVKIDISTGHAITPPAVNSTLDVMFADPVPMLVYPVETVVAEKLQTVLVRATFNTRMRDFYDLHAILAISAESFENKTLKEAVSATFERRGSTDLLSNWKLTIDSLESSEHMQNLWSEYRRSFTWALDLTWNDAVGAARVLLARGTE
ncbi:MAG: nucleotidyl transferase AbiEii/AbiGii toxin family protein [Ancrocorticia sp.]